MIVRNRAVIKKYINTHPICEKCKINKSTQVHHIIEVVNGGDDSQDNLVALCDECHKSIHKPNNSELTKNGLKKDREPTTRSKYNFKIKLLEYIDRSLNDYDHISVEDIIDLIVSF